MQYHKVNGIQRGTLALAVELGPLIWIIGLWAD